MTKSNILPKCDHGNSPSADQELGKVLPAPNSKGLLKVGIDVHLEECVLVCQHAFEKAGRARKLPWQAIVSLVDAWVVEGFEVVCVQEACGFGYEFHHQLEAAGATSLVVAPEALGQRKTDKLDARKLCHKLSNYLNGQKDELRPIRIPTPAEIAKRDLSRHRAFLKEEIKAIESRGAALYRAHTHLPLRGRWWGPRIFKRLLPIFPEAIVDILSGYQVVLLELEQQLKSALAAMCQPYQGKELPFNLGVLSWATIDAEVCNWQRFHNRRQAGSYPGLCPQVKGSAGEFRYGPIDRHGNGRLRHQLVEAVWRLVNCAEQSQWHALVKWRARLGIGKAIKKKTVVALARQLMVDLWRWQTGQQILAGLGLKARTVK